jgi:hypothetical protein
MFSVFSISEHLLFALYAVPFAVIQLVLGAFGWFLLVRLKPRTTVNAVAIIASVQISIFIGAALIAWRGEYITLGAIVVIALSLMPFYVANNRYQFQLVFLYSMPIVGFCLSFVLGVNSAQGVMEDPQKWSRVDMDGGMIEGGFVRSGERGVMLYDNMEKKFMLVPWSKIKLIENKFIAWP